MGDGHENAHGNHRAGDGVAQGSGLHPPPHPRSGLQSRSVGQHQREQNGQQGTGPRQDQTVAGQCPKVIAQKLLPLAHSEGQQQPCGQQQPQGDGQGAKPHGQ